MARPSSDQMPVQMVDPRAKCIPDPISTISPNKGEGLYMIPWELRQMIFKLCLEYNGESPSLLEALRPESSLHDEAVKIYNKINTKIILNKSNDWSTDAIAEETLKCGKILVVELNQEIAEYNSSLTSTGGSGYANMDTLEKTLANLTNLKLPIVDLFIQEVPDQALGIWNEEQWRYLEHILIRIPIYVFRGCSGIRTLWYCMHQSDTRTGCLVNSVWGLFQTQGAIWISQSGQWDITPRIFSMVVNAYSAVFGGENVNEGSEQEEEEEEDEEDEEDEEIDDYEIEDEEL